MRGRNGTAYKSASYSAFAMLARLRMLDFCRIVSVVREGRIVKRMINDPEIAGSYGRPPVP